MGAVSKVLRCAAAAVFALGVLAGLARAQAPTAIADPTGGTLIQPFSPTGAPQTSATGSEVTTVSIQRALGPYGDPGGLRAFLQTKGIDYDFTYVADILSNTSGGFKRGTAYVGRLDGEVNVDAEKLAGIKGLTLHSNFYQINGRSLTSNNVMDLFTISGLDAYPDTKLYEAWFEQKLFGDKIAVRAGQIAADAEFLVSQTASVFVDSTYGFPAIFGNNLPSGGISYPYAAPAAQVKYQPNDNVALTTVLFDGDPGNTAYQGMPNYYAGLRDSGGVAFRLRDAPLLLSELQVIYNNDKTKTALPGTIRVGYLHHFGDFQAFDVPPTVTTTYRGNDGAYFLIDQSIYRERDHDGGASVFLRFVGAPSDRNLFDRYVDAGIAYQSLLPGRYHDTVGVSGVYARISPAVTQLDIASGAGPLVRTSQSLIEATYQYVVVDGFTIQPDIQYIVHPGANGVADMSGTQPLRNALVLGTRVTVVY